MVLTLHFINHSRRTGVKKEVIHTNLSYHLEDLLGAKVLSLLLGCLLTVWMRIILIVHRSMGFKRNWYFAFGLWTFKFLFLPDDYLHFFSILEPFISTHKSPLSGSSNSHLSPPMAIATRNGWRGKLNI